MAKIPLYEAGKLASSRTNVLPADTTGQELGQAAAQLGQDIYGVQEQQKDILRRAEIVKTASKLNSELATLSLETRRANVETPDEASKQLKEKAYGLVNQYKETLSDPEAKIQFDALGTQSSYEAITQTNMWAFQENNKKIQKNLAERIQTDAYAAAASDDLGFVLGQVDKLGSPEDRRLYYDGWQGMAEGDKVVKTGQRSILNAYFTNQISKGNSFRVLKELDEKQISEGSAISMILGPDEVQKFRSMAKTMLLKGQKDDATLALISSGSKNFDVEKDVSRPVAGTIEEITGLSFDISRQKMLVEEGMSSPELVTSLQVRLRHLEKVREFQMADTTNITPNEEVEGAVAGKFNALFKWKGSSRKGLKATLEDIHDFQNFLDDSRMQLDPKTYEKFNALTKASFQTEIEGSKKSLFGTKQQIDIGPFKFGDAVSTSAGALSSSRKLQKVLSGAMQKYGEPGKNAQNYNELMYFIDALDDLGVLKDENKLSMISEQDLGILMQTSEMKAALQASGLPIYNEGKDQYIVRGGKRYRIDNVINGRIHVVEEGK